MDPTPDVPPGPLTTRVATPGTPPAPTPAADDSARTGPSDLSATTPDRGKAPLPRPAVAAVGMYQVSEELARGGMGVVYRARHLVLDREVALKMMRANARAGPQDAQRFEREMRAAARLRHPNILPIYEIGWHEGQPFYTMPFVSGGSLAALRGRWPHQPRAVLATLAKVARAVQHAHEQGIVHRDLKPANVLLDEHGEPLVTDFGLAKLQDDDELTQTGAVLGTPGYMAPEQAAGQTRRIGPHTDVWALGVILYEVVTGRRPFVGDSTDEVKDRIRHAPPPRPRTLRPDLARPLERVILKCLEKDPLRRYASAAEFADDLERYLRGERPRAAAPPRPWRLVRGHLGATAALALGVVGVLALTAAAFWPRPQAAPQPPPAPSELPPPIVLLDDKSPPADAHWLAGAKMGTIRRMPPVGPLTLANSHDISLFVLSPAPPWPHFRLEADVRAEEIKQGTEAGVFFSHAAYPTAQGTWHTFRRVGFVEFHTPSMNGAYGEAGMSCSSFLDATPYPLHGVDPTGGIRHRFPTAIGAPAPLRTVALEVDADGIRAYFGDTCVEKINRQRAEQDSITAVRHLKGTVGHFSPHAPLGVYIQNGLASFHRVVLKPLR